MNKGLIQFGSGLKSGQKKLGEDIAIIINSILLTIVYIVGVGVTSIFARIYRKNFMELKIEENNKSYWSSLNLNKKPIEEYYRQF